MKIWSFSRYSSPQTLVLQPPTIDAYVNAATNYGTATYIQVGYGTSRRLSGYLQFDLSAIENKKALITSCILSLRRYVTGFNIQFYIKAVTSAWVEAEIVLANSPTLDGVKYDSHPCGTGGDEWVNWNITNLVQRISNGELTNYGFTLQTDETTPSTQEYYRSREYVTAGYRPKLTLNYRLRK